MKGMQQTIPLARPMWHPSLARRGRVRSGVSAVSGSSTTGVAIEAPVDPAALSGMLVAVGTARDKGAFADLFRFFAPRLKSYLLRLGSDGASAEEAMQEAMVLIWRKASLYDPAKASASTWIFTIARNVRIDRIRRERRPQFDPNDPALVPDPADVPDASLARSQSREHVREALAGLSAAEREVLQLSFFEELSHSEIAKAIGVPLGTVKSRIRLAFGKLRGSLAEYEGRL
jgi:RNA polymerase sigma-70 factor (ECF subfamily)